MLRVPAWALRKLLAPSGDGDDASGGGAVGERCAAEAA